jgi:Tol biopolymer transport system component
VVPENTAASSGVLNSWKEIAAYLNRDVRTVMRWEDTRGLPVHRLPGGPKSAVYGIKSEIDAWRKGRRLSVIDVQEESHIRTPPAAILPYRSWKSIVLLAVAFVLLIGSATLVVWRVFHTTRGATPYQLTRLTYEHAATWPTISADGKLLAYASEREGRFDIYVQQLAGHQPIRVTHNEADNFQPSLSPDGSRIAFRSERDGGGVYIVETLGGTERKIADRGAFPSYSPDGSTIAYVVRNGFSGNAKMFLIPAEGGSGRPFQPDFELPPTALAFSVPIWSPDGREVLFEGIRDGDLRMRGLWVAPVAGGPATQVRAVPPRPSGTIRIFTAWAGSYLYYIEGTSVQGTPLMRVPISPSPWRITGPAKRLTSSSTVCGSARVAADGRLVLMITSFLNNMWSASLNPKRAAIAGNLKQETTDTDNKLAMSVASNGSRLAYTNVLEIGRMEIRLIDLHTRQLTAIPLSSDNLSAHIRLSPDGSRLGYRDFLNGKLVSYNVAATNPGQSDPICEGCSLEGFFSRSEDVLVRYGQRLVRQNASKGVRNTLTEFPARDPALSPDDQWVAFVAPRPGSSAGLFVAPIRDQAVPPSEWILVAEDRNAIGSPRWSPAGNFLYYVSNRDSFSCVWAQSFDARKRTFGEPIHVYHNRGFPSLRVNPTRTIDITSDRLYLMMANMTANIWTTKVDSR